MLWFNRYKMESDDLASFEEENLVQTSMESQPIWKALFKEEEEEAQQSGLQAEVGLVFRHSKLF